MTVDRWEGNLVVIRTDDGQELIIDRSLVPTGTKEGSRLALRLVDNQTDAEGRQQLARNLLKEILANKDGG